LDDIDFYFITDSYLSRNGIYSDVENAIKAGCRIVQYREKKKDTRTMIVEAKRIRQICENKALFLVNDRIDVALLADADGVHLGQNDMPYEFARKILGIKSIIGITVHNINEAICAERAGFDYVGVAPIFDTDTKENIGNPVGIDMIKSIRNKVNLPIVAVGGIKKDDIMSLIRAGADSLVSINPIVSSDDVCSEIMDYIRIIRECKKK
jgi:thiamine-phosphate pyrophosphorylase